MNTSIPAVNFVTAKAISVLFVFLLPVSLLRAQDSMTNNMGFASRIQARTMPYPSAIMDDPLHLYRYISLLKRDSVQSQVRKRVHLVIAANVLGYGGAMLGLYSAWYKNYPQSSFHTFNDNGEWLQMDKVGHMYSAYSESRGSMEMWRWTGIDRKKRIWIGGMSGALYQTVIETLDGFSSAWGWSWGDFTANIIGSGALVAQELAWDEQRIQLKFSFHRKSYANAQLEQRSNVLFGDKETERFLKDYNGQAYWASVNLHSFFPQSGLPRWLNLSFGYGAEGMFGAENNIGKDANGNIIFDRTDIKRYRQWYLSPDIDFTKIKTHKKAVRLLCVVLNAFKFPAPALEFSNGKFKGYWIYF